MKCYYKARVAKRKRFTHTGGQAFTNKKTWLASVRKAHRAGKSRRWYGASLKSSKSPCMREQTQVNGAFTPHQASAVTTYQPPSVRWFPDLTTMRGGLLGVASPPFYGRCCDAPKYPLCGEIFAVVLTQSRLYGLLCGGPQCGGPQYAYQLYGGRLCGCNLCDGRPYDGLQCGGQQCDGQQCVGQQCDG